MKRLIKKLLNKKQKKLHWYLLTFVSFSRQGVSHKQHITGNKRNYIDLEYIVNESNKNKMVLLSVSYLGYETKENMKLEDNLSS